MADSTEDQRRRGPLEDTVKASTEPPGEPPSMPALPIRPLPPGDRYRLGAELGRGGMGRVVEAFDLQLGRTVALKEVLPRGGASIVRRFEREVQLTARLEHPSIVPIYDSGITADGRPFYVMRRVSGRPFEELVAHARDLDERLTLLPALLGAIDAVAHAHRRGVIHRDLKPQNILVGELGQTIVIDWGLAKLIGETAEADAPPSAPPPSSAPSSAPPPDALQTQVGSVFGTPGFMSPEQARGEELGPRGDVFALGATLYQLLAGTPPHQGTSATEVIDKTARQDVRPLAEVAPGAPRALVAIVDKALAFDPRKRYPDAGALGEDVRRFLAGQLVAAHRYTSRERIDRFVRRHRAPLGVAAAAVVAVAVMAWIGVARILTARDAADVARATAEQGRREAEQARAALAERHDALLIAQARGLLDVNPTEAVAVLKAMPPTSPRLAEARALAQAAVVRGVAWAIPGPTELTVAASLDPGGRRLLQITRDGMVRVWDLERRRLTVARPYPPSSRALWIEGGRVLVMPLAEPPQIFDPAANTSEPLPMDPIAEAAATATGDRVVFRTAAPGVKLMDVARREVADVDPVAAAATSKRDPARSAAEFALPPDGSWIALLDRERTTVVDLAGKELARRPGASVRAVASAAGALALLTPEGKIVEYRLPAGDRPGGWTELPLALDPGHRIVDLIYRGGELTMLATSGALVVWNGERVFTRGRLERIENGLAVAADAVFASGGDGTLRFAGDLAQGALRLPAVVRRSRLAARPGAPRLIVVGDGLLVGYELGPVLPRVYPAALGTQAHFIDDRALLASRGVAEEWQWLDLATGAAQRFRYDLRGLASVSELDPTTGRALVREIGAAQRLLLFRKDSPQVRVVAEGRAAWGRLVPGEAIVFGVGDGRLFAEVEGGAPREIAKVDGVADSAVALGYRRFAARGSGGELVRGDLATGALERARVQPGKVGFVAADAAGRALLVEDDRLLAWDAAVTELARLDPQVQRLDPIDGGVLLHLADLEVRMLELGRGATPHRVLPPGKRPAVVSHDGKLVAGLDHARQVTIAELPSRARWTLPPLFDATDGLAVSPTARLVLQVAHRHLALWTLPEAGPDLRAWLDGLTSATIDADGVLAWPWQRASGGPPAAP